MKVTSQNLSEMVHEYLLSFVGDVYNVPEVFVQMVFFNEGAHRLLVLSGHKPARLLIECDHRVKQVVGNDHVPAWKGVSVC